jgi:FkbM family methyltransferase
MVIDGGSNIGMSLLFFKWIYPQSHVVCFEPDPKVLDILRENVVRNRLSDVTLVNAGLSGEAGTASFLPDGRDGGRVVQSEGESRVQMERLSDYLTEPVDFLKLNIEGEELPVLREAADSGKLRNVRQMVVEYHGWAIGDQRLGDLLALLDGAGFRYLVHDFDEETSPSSKPPFRLTLRDNWFCLIYATQRAG